MSLILDVDVYGGFTIAAGIAGAFAWRYADKAADPWQGRDGGGKYDPELRDTGPTDTGEHIRPLAVGGGRTGERLTAELEAKGLLLPVTARTLAARNRARAFAESAEVASRSFTARLRKALERQPAPSDSGAEVAAPPAPSVPAPARKGGRHAAPKGSKPQPVPVLVAESRFPGAAPAVAHEDRTEVLPALPALILGGETA